MHICLPLQAGTGKGAQAGRQAGGQAARVGTQVHTGKQAEPKQCGAEQALSRRAGSRHVAGKKARMQACGRQAGGTPFCAVLSLTSLIASISSGLTGMGKSLPWYCSTKCQPLQQQAGGEGGHWQLLISKKRACRQCFPWC